MAKPEPSMDEWLKEAKQSEQADQCGMFLVHNGIVRKSAKARVRKGDEDASDVVALELSYNAEGVEKAVADTLEMPGVYYARAWINEGRLNIGDTMMYVIVGADIRPRCIDALQSLVGTIKNEYVDEVEIYE